MHEKCRASFYEYMGVSRKDLPVVFQMWRYATHERPQASVLTAVILLS